MPKSARKTNVKYVEVGYRDKIIFIPSKQGTTKQRTKGRADVIATWQRSQGLWTDHPVFHGMTTKEIIEWLRGEDADV